MHDRPRSRSLRPGARRNWTPAELTAFAETYPVDDDAVSYAAQLLHEAREEVAHADAKATTILTSVGLISGVICAALLAGTWAPGRLSQPAQWAFWVAAALSALGTFFMASALWPRTKHAPSAIPYFFGHVAQHDNPVSLAEALGASNPAWRRHRTVDQAWAVSRIVVEKLGAIRRGMICYGLGAVAMLFVVGLTVARY